MCSRRNFTSGTSGSPPSCGTASGASRAAFWAASFAAGETEKTVSVAALADGVQEAAETLTLTLTDPSGATLARATATGTVEDAAAGNAAPFTAQFLGVPPEHDGESVFTFELRFSEEPPELSFSTVRDSLLAVTGGTVKRAKRITRGSNLAFRIHVEPAGLGAVTVAFRPAPECGVPGSVCTADGRALAGVATATIPGPASLSVADAEAREGPGSVLEFQVTLSRARHEATSVDYATSDGTAVAGEDYTAASGTLSFAAGETEKTVSVPLLNDAHDDDGETLTLTLSNPRPPETVRLGDAVATGTIRNADPLQKAWLARFGRTVAGQLADALEGRFATGADAASHMTVAGERLDLAGAAPVRSEPWRERREEARGMELRELLLGSSFHFSTGPASGSGRMTGWGRAVSGGSGGVLSNGLSFSSETATGVLGMDWERDGLLFGLALTQSVETGDARSGQSEYDIEGSLSMVAPYARFRAGDRLSFWGTVGSGEGGMTVSHEGSRQRADIAMRLAAAGGRAELLRPAAGSRWR